MENQQGHIKNNQPSLGHESHGVHVCHKCGWPFPNPHPSARHRRSHKKVCGTIEGYKLVDSSAAHTPSHLTVSDDEHLDEDSKTPSPKMEKSSYEIGGREMRVNSGISEDEMFSDAVTEFTDGGSGHGSEEAAEKLKETVTVQEQTTTKDASTTIHLLTEDATTGFCADDKSHMQNIQVQELDQTGNDQEFKDHVSDPITGIVKKSTDHGTEESVNEPNSSQVGSEHLLWSLETKVDVSQENKEIIAAERKTETVMRRNSGTGSDGASPEVVVSPKDNVAESTDDMSNVGKDIASDPAPPTGVVQSKKEHTKGVCLPSPIGNLAAEDKSNLGIDADAAISQPKLDDAERIDSDNTSNLVEYHDEKRQPDENVHLLSIPDNLPTVNDAETMSKGFKDHDGGKFPKFMVGDSLEMIDEGKFSFHKDNVAESTDDMSNVGKEDIASDPVPPTGVVQSKKEHTEGVCLPSPIGNLAAEDKSNLGIDADAAISQPKLDDAERIDSDNTSNLVEYHDEKRQPDENVHLLSIPDNIPTVNDVETMIKGFKDHDGGKFPKFMVGDSLEMIDEGKFSFHKDDPSNFLVKPLDEVTDILPMDTHFVKDDLEMKIGSSKPTVLPPEDEYNVAQSNFHEKKSDDLAKLSDSVAVEAEKSSPQDYGTNLSENDSVGHFMSVQSELKLVAEDAPVVKMHNEVGDNTGSEEETKNGCEEAEHDKKGSLDDNGTESVVGAPRTVGILSDIQKDERATAVAGDDKQTRDGKTELSKVSGIETGEVDSSIEVGEKSLSAKSEAKTESSGLQAFEFQPNTKDKVDVSEAKIADSGHNDANTGLDSVQCWKEESTTEGQAISGTEAEEANQSKPASENLLTNIDRTGVSATINFEGGTRGNLPKKTECKSVDETLTTPDCLKKLESKDDEQVHASECAKISAGAESDDRRITKLKQNTPNEHTTKEHQNPHLSEASSFTVKDSQTGSSIDLVAGDKPETHHGEGTFNTQQIGTPVSEFSVDSVSRTDSLEGHWGSVSVLSSQSDIPASVDAESLQSIGHQASPRVEKDNIKDSKAPAPGQHPEESDMFEPPSFMTLVEPKAAKSDPKADSSEIPTAYNMQQSKTAPLQAGWFPSLTHVANKSEGRKQNEEIIAKVTNWNAGKQRSPLKNLLGDAKVEGKSRSPNAAESPMSTVQIGETKAKDNGASATTISSILAPEAPNNELAKTDAGKEWNSPARYPTNIKREKRKVKGRPYWAQFVCCSSGN